MLKLPSKLLYRVVCCSTLLVSSGLFFNSYSDGLPQEYLLTQRWRTLFSTTSPLTNPTFINNENYLSGRVIYSSILNQFNTLEAGVVMPLDLYQTVGVTIINQGVGSYDATDANGTNLGRTISENTSYIMGTYAYNIIGGLDLGINANIMYRNFIDVTTLGAGADVGLSYRLFQHPALGVHTLGANLQHALFMALSGEKDILPKAARFSLNSTYFEKQIESAFDFSLEDIGTAVANYQAGSSPKSEWNLDAKIGGWILRMGKVYGLLGMTDVGLSYLGLAGGVNLPSFNNGRDLELLIQYLNLTDVENQTPTSFISMYVQADMGKHREEVYARKMARMSSAEPNDLYIKGTTLYTQGNYWEAFFIFSRLFVEYPDFFKNDYVSYFLGSCQENLDMRLTAEEAYTKTKEMYSRSAAVPFSDLGLMRVYYRDGNFGAVENQFNELNKLGVPDSIKYHAYYYMGQTEMKKQNYSKAKQLFELIPETHTDYVFAQHTSAICNAQENNMEGAIYNLENCIQAQVTTNAQKEIVNRSYVFIGYMFYEELTQQEGPLAKAVTAFRMVPKNSSYYVDALQGLAWTALKARQWNDCKSAAQEIQSTTKNTVTKAEGALLEAYVYMVEKNYNSAVTLLDQASKALEDFKLPSQAELLSRQDENNAIRSRYTEIARKAYDLGVARQSEIVIKEIDSLHIHQKDMKQQIDGFLDFVDVFERGTFFSRNYESIKEDVEYALARAEKLGGQIIQQKKMDNMKSEEDKLNEEIRRAQEELEKQEQKNLKQEDKTEKVKEPKKAAPVIETPPPALPEDDVPMEELFDEEEIE